MELLLALGIPAILLILAVLLLANKTLDIPNPLYWLGQRNATFWNIMVGTGLAIVAIKFAISK